MHAASTDALARALGTIVRDVEADFQRQLAVFRAEGQAVVAELRADLAEARQQRDALVIELRDMVAALRPAPAAPAAPAKSPVEALKELKALFDSGVLTQEEYEAKRKVYVDQL